MIPFREIRLRPLCKNLFSNIAVHESWAPLGAKNFLDMVTTGFFSSKVAFFRALKGFLVQFGLSGDPTVQKRFDERYKNGGRLRDDPVKSS